MEALKNGSQLILLVFIYLFSCQIQSQPTQSSNQNLANLMSKYEANKDSKLLMDLMIYGSNDVPVLTWFERNMNTDDEVLTYAGIVFFESSLPQWNAKAEATLLSSLRLNPQAGVASRLGDLYLQGKHAALNTRKACEMYERAYKINSESMNNIQYAFCLVSDSMDRDFRKSDVDACNVFKSVAYGYFKFTGISEYWDAARAYYFHGECLDTGKAGQKNSKEAVEWFKRGMSAGGALAAFSYAEHLESGIGVLRDPKGALAAYNKAASLGLNLAQNRLGVIYAEGELVSKNMAEAYKWFLIATSNGYEPAMDNRKRAELKLTSTEIKFAEQAAKKWMDQNSK